jgi:hypothetical protein
MSHERPKDFPAGFCFKHSVGTCTFGKKCKHSHGALPGGYKLPPFFASTSEKVVRFKGKCNFCKKAGHRSSACRARGGKGGGVVVTGGGAVGYRGKRPEEEESEEESETDEEDEGEEEVEEAAPVNVDANVDWVTALVNKSLAMTYDVVAHKEGDDVSSSDSDFEEEAGDAEECELKVYNKLQKRLEARFEDEVVVAHMRGEGCSHEH